VSGKTKLVIAIAALLLLCGGGAGGYFVFLAPAEPEVAEAPPPPDPGYVKVATVMAPVVRDGRLDQYLALGLTIELDDAAKVAEVEHMMPRLRDAFLREVSANALQVGEAAPKPDLESLRKRLAERASKVVGDGSVRTVLISSVLPVRS
jgi:flagellar FliL protein